MVHPKSILLVTIRIFLEKEFNFQLSFCTGCHDVVMIPININSFTILDIQYSLNISLSLYNHWNTYIYLTHINPY